MHKSLRSRKLEKIGFGKKEKHSREEKDLK